MEDILLGVLGVVASWSALCGAGWNLYHIFGEDGLGRKFWRNRREDSLIDQAVLCMIDEMSRGKDYNVILTNPSNRFYSEEEVHRADGKVKITNFNNNGYGQYMKIEIEGLGEYSGRDLKPEIATKLIKTCKDLKQYQALATILKPEQMPLLAR